MAGKQIDKNGKLTDYDLGNFTGQFAVGSSVKGGTLLAGYQNNAIKVGEEMIDEPLHFKGGLTKRSYFNKMIKSELMIKKINALFKRIYV